MPILSDEMLKDLSHAYSSSDVLDLLDVDTFELLLALRDKIAENLDKFDLKPVDCACNDNL